MQGRKTTAHAPRKSTHLKNNPVVSLLYPCCIPVVLSRSALNENLLRGPLPSHSKPCATPCFFCLSATAPSLRSMRHQERQRSLTQLLPSTEGLGKKNKHNPEELPCALKSRPFKAFAKRKTQKNSGINRFVQVHPAPLTVGEALLNPLRANGIQRIQELILQSKALLRNEAKNNYVVQKFKHRFPTRNGALGYVSCLPLLLCSSSLDNPLPHSCDSSGIFFMFD